MDQNGPFWSKEVHFGPFRSANRTLASPDSQIVLTEARLLKHHLHFHGNRGEKRLALPDSVLIPN